MAAAPDKWAAAVDEACYRCGKADYCQVFGPRTLLQCSCCQVRLRQNCACDDLRRMLVEPAILGDGMESWYDGIDWKLETELPMSILHVM